MNIKYLLACLCVPLAMSTAACDADDGDGGGGAGTEASTGGVEDDDTPIDDDGQTSGSDTDVEPTTGVDPDPEATTGFDTDVDPGQTTGEDFPEDCSCYNPAAQGELPEDGCLDFAEIYLGCEPAAEDCGTFTVLWDTETSEGDPTKADNTALDCVIAGLGGGGAPAFVATSPSDDPYGGQSEYSPLPQGGYGRYACNTTNEGSNSMSFYAAPVAEDVAACADAADYFEKVDCVLDTLIEADEPALLSCE